MQPFVLFLIAAYLTGVTRLGGVVRRRPVLLVAFSTLAAVSFYSLRVAM